MSDVDVATLIRNTEARFVDLRFTDLRGKEQHVTLPATIAQEEFFKEGKLFDASSIAGWQKIHQSDMLLMPDLETAVLDPFTDEPTILVRCQVYDPDTRLPYNKDPRVVAEKAEQYLLQTGIADHAYFGPEPEFFILDDVRWEVNMRTASYKIDAEEAAWNSNRAFEGRNSGHRPSVKGGYFPVPPVDSSQDLRSAISLALENMGLIVEAHHHEVATANQNEIATRFNTLKRKADEMMILKYVVHNVCHAYGKTATFMPKPIVGDNGSGMHCHQSLFLKGNNVFAGSGYAGLSETALYYIGGIIHHAKSLNAITNPSTNSYKRLVPGFEAPCLLAYSGRNRSASIRIPYCSAKAKRIEVRFPDPMANPYLAFAAQLMAGLDGIQKKIHPGQALDKNLYELPEHELRSIPKISTSLEEALQALEQDHDYLLAGNVFTSDLLESFVALKQEEISRVRMTTHPVEFELYYSL